MPDDDIEPTVAGRPGRWSILRWLTATAAVASIVAAVISVIEWTDSRTSAPQKTTGSGAVTGDESFVQVGQCVRNMSDTQDPVLKIADCGPGTLRVLARIEQKIDEGREADEACTKAAPEYTDYHYSNWARQSNLNIVFCLRSE